METHVGIVGRKLVFLTLGLRWVRTGMWSEVTDLWVRTKEARYAPGGAGYMAAQLNFEETAREEVR